MTEPKNAATSILNIVSQINPMIGAAVGILNTIRAIRAAAQAANATDENGELPSDVELIQTLMTESGMLKTEASELKDWLKTL